MSKDITYEQAKKIVDEHDARLRGGLASDTDSASGIVMKAQDFDPSVLTYDPKDVEQDKDVAKRAAADAKAAEEADKK